MAESIAAAGSVWPLAAEKVAAVLADKGLRWAIITTPEARVLGVASREDLLRAGQAGAR